MINYSAHDIKRYLNRQMNAAEMHAFETAMMDDPMLADAVDGYQSAEGSQHWEENLAEITKRLNPEKENGKLVVGFFKPWMRMAAGLIILLGAAVVLIRFLNQTEPQKNIASTDLQQQEMNAPTLKEIVVDSNTVAFQEQEPVKDNTITVKPSQKTTPSKQSTIAETKSDDLAVSEPETVKNTENVLPLPPSAPFAAAEKKQEAIDRMETRAKAKTATLNKFTGVVVDENNNPLPFANITEVNSGVGTYADVKGNFTLIAADTVLNIQTKFLGYSNANVLLRNNQSQRIILKDEAVIAGAPTRDQLYMRNKSRVPTMKEEITEMESEPADGWTNYSKYVMNNLRTEDFNEKRKFGETQTAKEVELSFDVQPDGSIANITVVRSTCGTCNQEAVRLIKEGPKWRSKTGKKERGRLTVQF